MQPLRNFTLAIAVAVSLCFTSAAFAQLQVGAAAIDVTPQQFPVLINGSFYSRTGEPTNIFARAIVVSDGASQLAIVVTDSCMLPKDLIDSAKQLASEQTKIPTDRILMSATHTHSAPSSMGALGTEPDETYTPYLRIKLAEAIVTAQRNLAPAKVGYATADANEFTALRRWIFAPDQMGTDPFGNKSMRAQMHAAKSGMEKVTGESGPEDPSLAVISFQSPEGRPIAMLANFSMHYFGGGGAADYFGDYCRALEAHYDQKGDDKPPFVAVMSHGCSGDIWRVDYRAGTNQTYDGFVEGMVDRTERALAAMKYDSDATIAMAETRMRLNYRVPSNERLTWAKGILAEMGERTSPKTPAEVYAREQPILHERQSTEIVLQALRIGDIAIATTPNETYALTGLKLKARSPFEKTFVIELANGGDGYIPPPEQHVLGGYNTWAARSAGLEVTAEPKIVSADLKLLEKVTGKPRREATPPDSVMAKAIANLKPVRYYPLDEMEGPTVSDASASYRDATYEDGVVFYLTGADGPAFSTAKQINRAAHFAGGRIITRTPELKGDYTVNIWCWNGLDLAARPIAGWMFSRDYVDSVTPEGIQLGLAGKGDNVGRVVLQLGDQDEAQVFGKTPVERWTWHNVTLVKSGDTAKVYLDGKLEITADASKVGSFDHTFFGGRSDNQSNWEGRLDEISVFDRALTDAEIAILSADGSGKGAEVAATPQLSEEDKTKGGRHWVDEKTPAPRSPEEELAAFKIEPGYKIELVASEPLVMDPVAIAFDARGRMFVAEYSDYPIGPPDEKDAPLSRIVLLEDTNGDGKLDKRSVFADKLTFCHSLMPYAGGVLACAQTQVLLLKDENDDGVAESREVVFDGFVPAHAQMQVGNPRWGLDNKIYLNYGVGKITKGGSDAPPFDMPRTEFWFHPITREFGPAAGTGQFGNTITQWGDRLFVTNRNPIIAAPMTMEELRRNRFSPIYAAQYDVAPSGGDSKVFPLVAMKSNWLSHAGTHTSACGTTAYVGDALGPAMEDSVFACEPIGHLVTRAIVTRDGARLTSKRAREDADFLAATDTWFRPASLANGPDGNLYLADMYRLWVEHPKFLPPEIAARLDWRAGEDRGRIWRITADNKKSVNKYVMPKTTDEWVAMLGDSNGWRRRLAQQTLVEGQVTAAAPAIEKLFAASKSPLARLHAIWTLAGIGQLKDATIKAALTDANPHVRASAVDLASQAWSDKPELLTAALSLADDKDPFVRYRLALAMGTTADPRRVEVLAKLVASDGADVNFADAIMTATETCSGEVLAKLADPAAADAIQKRLAKVVGARKDEAETASLVKLALGSPAPHQQLVLLAGLAEGINSNPKFETLLKQSGPQAEKLTERLEEVALGDAEPLADRREAILLLARFSSVGDDFFADLLHPRFPPQVQLAAIDALGGGLNDKRAQVLLTAWTEMEPQSHEAVLAHLLKSQLGVESLFAAIKGGKVSASAVSLDHQRALHEHRNEAIRKAAAEVFGKAASTDRDAVLAAYEEAPRTIGSAVAGREVFLKNCAKCHVATEESGRSVGPDLADSLNRPREAILYDILNPSGKVEPKYAASQILTLSGQSYIGIVASQSGESIVLQLADGKLQETPRSEIDLFQTSEKSLMPEGMEKEINVTDMANLLEFLKSPLPKK
ncbi:HEAT repeat domain-containing protein [Blastopirellula sp. JC732]|uniref:HEAT repeat domain-containing protein n=1 Tax=Blastopirellula sediminis TaxID=2894196 RepID=A0A9X1MJ70_9BACT|nr:PVC-type heme-binding CxxCH protein [Blastopirellula sediminis]MCC9607905.1 HEAT repeat domain-containing protein [Blastopirellula sediminis]MCC9627302.1 HEAT repeat domain-containing protein [Blastopirellula sediminis]